MTHNKPVFRIRWMRGGMFKPGEQPPICGYYFHPENGAAWTKEEYLNCHIDIMEVGFCINWPYWMMRAPSMIAFS